MGTSFLRPRNNESRISKFMDFCNNIQELETKKIESQNLWISATTFKNYFQQERSHRIKIG